MAYIPKSGGRILTNKQRQAQLVDQQQKMQLATTGLPPGGEFGAAGRGENPENAAYYEASAKLGIPASAAETVTKTKKGSSLVSSIQARNALSAPVAVAPSAKTSRASRYSLASGTRGLTATSSGGIYGSAGRDTLTTSTVDRSAGVPGNPLDEYMSFLSPQAVLNRQKTARRELERERQGQLDAIRSKYASQVSTEQAAGQEDLARQRSMNLRAGLGGSDFGAANKIAVRDRTNKNIQAIEANQDIEIGNVLNDIEQLAQSRVQQEQQALQQGFSNMFQYQQYTGQQQQQQRAQAVDSIAQLGKSGLDLPAIKERDPQLYESLAQASGMGDLELEAVLNNAKPPAEKVDYKYEVFGNRIVAYGVDSMGNLKKVEQQLDFEVPQNMKPTFAPDGTMMLVPDQFDPSIPANEQIQVVGNYAKSVASNGGTAGGQLSGLAQAVVNGTVSLSDLTPTQRGQVAAELANAGENPNLKANRTIATDALTAVEKVLKRVNNGETWAIGGTSMFGTLPGTNARDFVKDYENLRGLLSLDAVQYLKGTGQLSDAEQRLLANAASSLSRDQSEENFKSTLETLKSKLEKVAYAEGQSGSFKNSAANSNNEEIEVRAPNGTIGTIPTSQLQEALSQGYTKLQ